MDGAQRGLPYWQSLLDVFDEKDAEGFRTEGHEHGTRPYIYRL